MRLAASTVSICAFLLQGCAPSSFFTGTALATKIASFSKRSSYGDKSQEASQSYQLDYELGALASIDKESESDTVAKTSPHKRVLIEKAQTKFQSAFGEQEAAVRPPFFPKVHAGKIVLKVDPSASGLSNEALALLEAVIRRLRADAQLNIRLKAFSPRGEGPSWNVVAAERSLRIVKEYLAAKRISQLRIQAASYGGEYEVEHDKQLHWVELFYIQPKK